MKYKNFKNEGDFFDEGALAFQIDFSNDASASSIEICRSRYGFSAAVTNVVVIEDCVVVNFSPFSKTRLLPPLPTIIAFSFNGYIKWLPPVLGTPRVGAIYATRSYAGAYTVMALEGENVWMRDLSGWEVVINPVNGAVISSELVSP